MSDRTPLPAAAAEQPPLVEVRDLRVGYRRRGIVTEAVAGVSFNLSAGEFVALVGESGSGKSTIANTLTGLLPPTAGITGGEVLLGGTSILDMGERRWSRLRGSTVGWVPQDPGSSLNPVKTVGAQVSEIFRIRGLRLDPAETRRRSIELLETAEVSRAADRLAQFPHELSGGLKQRILIAIAFGLNPKVLVADEPTSALDVTVQKQVLRVFDRLAEDHGTTVLFVTHDIALATDHADRVLVMQNGRLLEDAPPRRLVVSPTSAYARTLIQHARESGSGSFAPVIPGQGVALSVRNLTKRFAARSGQPASATAEIAAVDDVSFDVRAGSTVALVGESGSGKSTTARMILRLLDPTSGSIEVLGNDVMALRGRDRLRHWRSVQMVYQNPDSALDPRWTVADIVAEPLVAMGIGSRRDRERRVRELLDSVALPAAALHKRPTELSGGQRQRVAIARALAPRSRIVVLDEALSALDVVTQEQVLRVLGELQGELGLSYLFISHDLSIVRRIAHDVVVMRSGRVVESGETAEVFRSPKTEYVRELLAAVPGGAMLLQRP